MLSRAQVCAILLELDSKYRTMNIKPFTFTFQLETLFCSL